MSQTLESSSVRPSQPRRPDSRETAVASLALFALGIICILAFCAPADKVVLSDKIGLLFLGVSLALILWTPLLRLLEAQSGATTFVLTVGMFVIYSIARRFVPESGWSMRFAAIPDDEYIFPYSSYAAVFGALLTTPFWWKKSNHWTRAVLAAVVLLSTIAAFSLWLLGNFYRVGPTETVDPSRIPALAFLLLEFSCVALLCRAVCVNPVTRRVALRVLPLVLLALWARFHFIAPPEEAE